MKKYHLTVVEAKNLGTFFSPEYEDIDMFIKRVLPENANIINYIEYAMTKAGQLGDSVECGKLFWYNEEAK